MKYDKNVYTFGRTFGQHRLRLAVLSNLIHLRITKRCGNMAFCGFADNFYSLRAPSWYSGKNLRLKTKIFDSVFAK